MENLIVKFKPSTLLYILIFFWMFIALSSRSNQFLISYISWISFGFILIITYPFWLKSRYKFDFRWICGFFLLGLSILISSFQSSTTIYNMIQFMKLFFIFVIGMVFVVSITKLSLIAFRSIQFVAAINFILLLLGYFGFSFFARIVTADGRWETLINSPGTLGGFGLALITYAFVLLTDKKYRVHGFSFLIISLVLLYFEGSRTGWILTFLSIIFTLFLLLVLRRKKKISLLMVLSFLAIVTLIGILLVFFSLYKGDNVQTNLEQSNRILQLIKFIEEKGVLKGMLASDPIRAEMLEKAVREIIDHPFLGTGLGTTRIVTDTGNIEVHIAYLQIWADAGFFAFLGFVWINWAWLFWLNHVIKYLKKGTSIKEKALIINAVFILLSTGVSNLFHTYSTEWTQWIYYLTASGIYWNSVYKYERRNDSNHGIYNSHHYV